MAPGWMQILLVVIVAMLLFGGKGRISNIMGDMAIAGMDSRLTMKLLKN